MMSARLQLPLMSSPLHPHSLITNAARACAGRELILYLGISTYRLSSERGRGSRVYPESPSRHRPSDPRRAYKLCFCGGSLQRACVRMCMCATCDSHDRWNSQPVINKVALCACARLYDSAYLYQQVVYCQWQRYLRQSVGSHRIQ